MKIQVNIKGVKTILKAMKAFPDDEAKAVRDVLALGALQIHAYAVKSIQKHQSKGEKYGKHTASREGFPPNSDTGRLVQSIEFNIDTERLEAQVGTNLKYGAWLEHGTENVGPRPWLKPAFDRNIKDIVKKFETAIIKAAKAAGK